MPLSDFSFDVRVTTRSGSARQNSDYTSWDSTETFLHSDFSAASVNGELRYRAEKQITIDIQDDIHKEGDEVFTVRLAYSNSRLPYLQGSSATATVTIIDDENLDPTISTRNPPSTYRENGTSAVYTFRASDPQGGPITWTLEGDDRGDFTITEDSSGQGVLSFSASPDYENPSDTGRENDYELTVIATDEDSRTDRLSFTIAVTDECASAGEPPCAPGRPNVSSASDTSLRVTWSAPRTPSGTSITGYDLQYRESDSGNNWIPQSVTGTDRSHTIENLIKSTSYEVQIRANNDSSGYGEWSESGTGTPGRGGGGGGGGGGAPPPTGPVFTDGTSTSRSVAVPAPDGADVGDPVAASHPANLGITYSLIASVPVLFTVDEMTGQIRLGQGVSLVSGQTYTVTVKATDSTGVEAFIDVVIEVEPHQYDLDRNGNIDRSEAVQAVLDYQRGQLTRAEAVQVILLYHGR